MGGLPRTPAWACPPASRLDDTGTIYIADRFNQRIRKIDDEGTISTLVGNGSFSFSGDGGPGIDASFKNPVGVFVDHREKIYIADSGNNRIRKVTPLLESTPASGLLGSTTVLPGSQVQIFSISFTGDGINVISAITLTLSDLTPPTGLVQRDLAALRLYVSSDALFDNSATLIGSLSQNALNIGSPTTIEALSTDIPPPEMERFYIITAVMNTIVEEGHAFKVEFAQGGVATTLGSRGTLVAASDDANVAVDVIASHLVFTTQPAGSLSGLALLTQPVLNALDDYGNLDTGFADLLTLSENAPGVLENNTATPVGGITTFANLTSIALADNESFILTANDSPEGAEETLDPVQSSAVLSDSFNDPPQLDFPPLRLEEDSAFILALADLVSDLDDTKFSWTFSSTHIFAEVEENLATLTPAPEWSGTDSLVVVVSDPKGASATARVAVVVSPIAAPPILSLPDTLEFVEDDTLRIALGDYLEDPDYPLADLQWFFSTHPDLTLKLDAASATLAISAPRTGPGTSS